jgi:hypothetical protein
LPEDIDESFSSERCAIGTVRAREGALDRGTEIKGIVRTLIREKLWEAGMTLEIGTLAMACQGSKPGEWDGIGEQKSIAVFWP